VTVESATYIDDLNTSLPAAGDSKSEGDDHLRLIKSTIKNTFPNIDAAVTPTDTELNYVAGVTSAIQTQFAYARGLQISSLSADHNLAEADNGKKLQQGGAAASVNTATGLSDHFTVVVVNTSGGSIVLSETVGTTLREAGTTNTGNISLAAWGVATITHIGSNIFIAWGTGLS
jgi:hypothetical protein